MLMKDYFHKDGYFATWQDLNFKTPVTTTIQELKFGCHQNLNNKI